MLLDPRRPGRKIDDKQETGSFWGLSVPNGGGIDIDAFGGYYETQESGGVFLQEPHPVSYEGHSLFPSSYGEHLPTTGIALDRSTGDMYVGQKTYIDQFASPEPPGARPGLAAESSGEGIAARWTSSASAT